MDDKGWEYWSKHILEHVSSLEENVKGIYSDIKENNKNINTICIRLEELTRINDKIDSLKEEYEPIKKETCSIKNDIIALKIKSGFWGALSGTLATIATGLIYFLTKGD